LLATIIANDFATGATTNGLGNCLALVTYNLDRATAPPIAAFALELGHDISPTHLSPRYHINIYSYSHEVAVPFFSAPTDYLIALVATSMPTGMLEEDQRNLLSQVLLIPIVRFTSHIGSTAAADTDALHPMGQLGIRSTGSRPNLTWVPPERAFGIAVHPSPPNEGFGRRLRLLPHWCRA
jgi:hypothetical protein